jgi:hypothetical protein
VAFLQGFRKRRVLSARAGREQKASGESERRSTMHSHFFSVSVGNFKDCMLYAF